MTPAPKLSDEELRDQITASASSARAVSIMTELLSAREKLRVSTAALEFYAIGNVDLEPKPDKKHLYAENFKMNSPQWLSRSYSDYWAGAKARETLAAIREDGK